MLTHFQYCTLRAVFSAQKAGRLPRYLESTLRGVLGHCIHAFACAVPNTKCFLCERRGICVYARCFASTGGTAGAVNPFVLHALTDGKTDWEMGDCCTFDLTLFGEVAQHAGLFLDALQAMGERGWGARRQPFALETVSDPASGRLLYASGRIWLRNLTTRPLDCHARPASTALLRFDTPVRVEKSKALCSDLSFATLVKSITRRLALLSQAYTRRCIEWDDSLFSLAAQVKTRNAVWREVPFVRYSMNQAGNKLPLPAITGWAMYEGELQPFVPLLQAGQIVHVGKNATHGFGHYTIAYDR